MPDHDLIAEIRSARQILRQEEERTHDAAIELQNSRKREKLARAELDALLDVLEKGADPRYPLFPGQPANGQVNVHVLTPEAYHAVELPHADGNGQVVPITAADETPIRVEPSPRGRGRRK